MELLEALKTFTGLRSIILPIGYCIYTSIYSAVGGNCVCGVMVVWEHSGEREWGGIIARSPGKRGNSEKWIRGQAINKTSH